MFSLERSYWLYPDIHCKYLRVCYSHIRYNGEQLQRYCNDASIKMGLINPLLPMIEYRTTSKLLSFDESLASLEIILSDWALVTEIQSAKNFRFSYLLNLISEQVLLNRQGNF